VIAFLRRADPPRFTTAGRTLGMHPRLHFTALPQANKRGLLNCASGVDAMAYIKDKKNIELFERLNVMTEAETVARADVMHEHYAGTVEIECHCMTDMIDKGILPAALEHAPDQVAALRSVSEKLKEAVVSMQIMSDMHSKAQAARVLRLQTLEEARSICDRVEGMIPTEAW